MIPLSLFIITFNEEDRLPSALASIPSWIKDVIIVDSGSTDNTQTIAKDYGARVIYRAWEGYGPQKKFAEMQCQHKWVINIDADEVISSALHQELSDLFHENKKLRYFGYQVPIIMLPRFTQFTKYHLCLARVHAPIRLYHRDHFSFKTSIIHDSVVSYIKKMPTGTLKERIHHRSCRSYCHAVEKINYYSTMQAEEWCYVSKKTPHILRIITEYFSAFLKAYIIRRYFLYGVEGFFESQIYAFGRALRLAKIWEKKKENI